MSVNKRVGFGILLAVDASGGTAFTNLGNIVDGISESEAKGDTVDTTILVDTYKTKSKTQVDPGEVSYTIAYDPDDSATQALKALLAQTGAVPPNWRVTFPGGTLGAGSITTKTFFAHLTGMGRESKKDGLINCPITLTKTGDPGF